MRKFAYILVTLAVIGLSLVLPASPVLAVDTTLYSSSSDGQLSYVGGDYASAHNAVQASFIYTGLLSIGQIKATYYWNYRSFVYFDTSSIPSGATITGAVLSIYGENDFSTYDFDIVIRNGQPTSNAIIAPTIAKIAMSINLSQAPANRNGNGNAK